MNRILRFRHLIVLLSLSVMTACNPTEQAEIGWAGARNQIVSVDLQRVVEKLVTISRKSRSRTQYWGRITGTPEDRETAEFLAEEFRNAGVEDVEITPVPVQIARPKTWTLTVDSAGMQRSLRSAMAVRNEKTYVPADVSIRAPIVFVGKGEKENFAEIDVHGKIVLVHRYDPDQPLERNTGPAEAFDLAVAGGAVALMFGGLLPGDLQIVPQLGSPMAGLVLSDETDRRIPSFSLSVEEASDLVSALHEDTQCTIQMTYDPQLHTESWNVEARIPGITDDWVFIVGHTDGYFDGAIDNGTGVAGLVGLVRALSSIPAKNRNKSYLVAGVGAHHDGSIGMRELVWRYKERLPQVAYGILLDHLAASVYERQGRRMVKTEQEQPRFLITTRENQTLLGTYRNVIDTNRFEMAPLGSLSSEWYLLACGSDLHISCDLFAAAGLMSPVQFYHSSSDTSDTFVSGRLEQCVRAHLDILAELDSVPRDQLQQFTGQAKYVVEFDLDRK